MAAGKWNMQKASGGVASITVADGVGATNIVLPESGTVATTSNIVGFKNYIINGNFDVWQYGTSQTSSGYGSDDRWINANANSTKTHSRVACIDTEKVNFNARFYAKTIVTSVAGAGNYVTKAQAIEDVTRLAGKTVTLSFWANADSNKNIAVEFSQVFGTGGSPSSVVSGIGSQTIALTTLWKKYIITLTLPSIVGKTIGTDGVHTSNTYMSFWFDAGSNFNTRTANLGQQSGTFNIAQVQLEEGSVATPFENRPYGLELSLCQRYYETGNARMDTYCTSNNIFGYYTTFKQIKRTVPTISVLSPSYVNSSTALASVVTIIGFFPNSTAISTSQAGFSFAFTASAEL